MNAFPVLFVLGPTGVGKSDLAVLLAEEHQGSVLNCDSVQCYEDLNIGAAKPEPGTFLRAPHCLFGWVKAGEVLTIARFREEALRELEKRTRQGPVFVAGGSGFYVRALERGLFAVKPIPREMQNAWRSRLAKEGVQNLYEELQARDPAYSERVKPQDAYRILRALMVIENEGRTMTEVRQEFSSQTGAWPYSSYKIGLRLTRDHLHQRIEQRTRKMLRAGFREEVEGLLARGLGDWPPLKSVGYREMTAYLQGELAEEELASRIVQSTLQLAKKQMTWFRSDPDIRWYEATPEFCDVREDLRLVLARLKQKPLR